MDWDGRKCACGCDSAFKGVLSAEVRRLRARLALAEKVVEAAMDLKEDCQSLPLMRAISAYREGIK